MDGDEAAEGEADRVGTVRAPRGQHPQLSRPPLALSCRNLVRLKDNLVRLKDLKVIF